MHRKHKAFRPLTPPVQTALNAQYSTTSKVWGYIVLLCYHYSLQIATEFNSAFAFYDFAFSRFCLVCDRLRSIAPSRNFCRLLSDKFISSNKFSSPNKFCSANKFSAPKTNICLRYPAKSRQFVLPHFLLYVLLRCMPHPTIFRKKSLYPSILSRF